MRTMTPLGSATARSSPGPLHERCTISAGLRGKPDRGYASSAALGVGVEFGILGPVEVGDHGERLRIGGAQRVAIVARLLLGRGDQVAVDQLVEDLWPGRTDPAVRATLQSHVSQLRKVIGADRLVGTRWGYALRVDPGELDADRFEIGLGAA